MFILFKKILNSNPAQLGNVLVRADSIFLYNEDTLEDHKMRVSYQASRVELSSFPNHSFYTLTTIDALSSLLDVVDMTSGVGSGSSCAGDAGVLDTVYAVTKYPMIRANMILNQNRNELQAYVFNPEYLIFAEDVVYYDQRLNQQRTALMIVLRDSQQKKILTDLLLADLVAVLEPIIAP